jgi:hypothetical protein
MDRKVSTLAQSVAAGDRGRHPFAPPVRVAWWAAVGSAAGAAGRRGGGGAGAGRGGRESGAQPVGGVERCRWRSCGGSLQGAPHLLVVSRLPVYCLPVLSPSIGSLSYIWHLLPVPAGRRPGPSAGCRRQGEKRGTVGPPHPQRTRLAPLARLFRGGLAVYRVAGKEKPLRVAGAGESKF